MQEWLKVILTTISTAVGITTLYMSAKEFIETRKTKKRIFIYDEHYKLLQIIEKRHELKEKGIEIPPLPPRIG
ncbi:hypothetical protein [Paenibacillus elgii]|uniref:hypothetical protein n=1 Tax=Paenibacillus elgii TaxID=189691 RepID=UPI0020409FA5|nr:hypothetical protein [Paenibacillus elgii]MCM3270870.1 hypothetical protein [Paenibacillus elgii]